MHIDYKELIEEIKEITTVDGFIAACLEIKESMFFYERDLMLAAYSASLEILMVVALLNGALKGRGELRKIEAELEENFDTLLSELSKFNFPLDVQHVVDHYLQENGVRTRYRMPVYIDMIHAYVLSTEDDLDGLMGKAHLCLAQNDADMQPSLNWILAKAGAQMLRGDHLRPIWLRISHPRIRQVLFGLQTLVNNLRVTSYFNYPLADIATEKQKRRKIKGNIVADLGVFRNFRQGGSGYTEMNMAFVRDEYDHFFERFFSGVDQLDTEPDQQVHKLLSSMFEVRLAHDDMDTRFLARLLMYCEHWSLTEFSDLFLDIMAKLDTEDPLFYEFWRVLKAFDQKALPAMRRFARTDRKSPFLPYLALFLSHGPLSKRRWTLLTEIFENYPTENEEKAQIAICIGKYGGESAVEYLEGVVAASASTEKVYREALEKALDRARASLSVSI